ncbi:MAG: DNA adenine methylase [Shewanella sp.]
MAYTIVKSPIVYYGGKTSIMHEILPLIPVHENYCEAFFGGGTVLFAKEKVKNETINDKLDIVINFYRILRTRFRPLKRLIDATLISRKIHGEGLQVIRAHQRGLKVDKVKLAWAFWLCTNFAFSNKIGGGYKYSNHMSTSVPDTLKKRKENFTDQLVQRIEHCYIENDDAVKVSLSRNTFKTYHYFDPPYPMADQGHYPGYGWDQFEKLLEFCADCKGKFTLSNYNSDMLDSFVRDCGWQKKEITHQITGKKGLNPAINRRERTEVLVWNYPNTCGTLKLF